MKLDGLTLEGSHALSYKRALHLSTGGWELGWGHRWLCIIDYALLCWNIPFIAVDKTQEGMECIIRIHNQHSVLCHDTRVQIEDSGNSEFFKSLKLIQKERWWKVLRN